MSSELRSPEFPTRLNAALTRARRELLQARGTQGHWIGELSSSALSTATAIGALSLVDRHSALRTPHSAFLIERGLEWLARNQNDDGGWGDTNRSISNISTTALCWAALGMVPGADAKFVGVKMRAEKWLAQHAGGIQPAQLVPAIIKRYGKDRTFSVPILTTCTLGGRLGPVPDAWRWVIQLPFELAAFPHQWFAALRLPVVSYALPALIAIGQARHFHLPTRNPLARLCRTLVRKRTLRVLQEIQPESGGFLEATPLTSFVVMSLASAGNAEHNVTKRGVGFLAASARADGSWPIDTNLATWVTTLAANALGERLNAVCDRSEPKGDSDRDRESFALSGIERSVIRDWLLAQQYQTEHPYTHAAPGGWAWTDLSGGVPDADDTAGAILALRRLGEINPSVRDSAMAGIRWLLDLQNRDGGIPTFCRGWGALPFDRSSPDLTAHALRAWTAWLDDMPADFQLRARRGIARAVNYLAESQRPDGSWVPLWFGNQFAPDDENPTYGTSRVLLALLELSARGFLLDRSGFEKGIRWLLNSQIADGGWSGSVGGVGSIEETALAVETLCRTALSFAEATNESGRMEIRTSALRGALLLVQRVERGNWTNASPIGFYFAKLWYYEKLYPMAFTVGALTQAEQVFGSEVIP